MDTREVYSIQDCLDVLDEVLEEELGLGFNIKKKISELIEQGFQYVNWNRFKHANCPGCVGSPEECDIAYSRGECVDCWKQINADQMQSCPVRCGGTFGFNIDEPKDGLVTIDLADHKFNVVLPADEEEKK